MAVVTESNIALFGNALTECQLAKAITIPLLMRTALRVAAYTRWVETQNGVSPSYHDAKTFICGVLEAEGLSYEPNEPQLIEGLAVTLNSELVDDFIRHNGIFEQLDQLSRMRVP
jgi:hypothetical protein